MFTTPETRAAAWLGILLAALVTTALGVAGGLSPAARPWLVALWLVALAAIGAVCVGWLRRIRRSLAALAAQLHQAELGQSDYPLSLNDEGAFSALHNDLYRYARESQAAKAALTRDRAQLSTAIQDIAHQLRTPIATQANLIELLGTAPNPATQAELTLQNRRLQSLVEQLILMARVDTHTLSQNREAVALDDLLRHSLDVLLPLIADAALEVVWQVPTGITVSVNPRLMQEAFINLLKNAAEHAPAESRLVIAAAQTPLATTVTIQNFGAALPEAELPHLFERFYRGSQSAPNSLGVGLAIAHGIVAAASGRLTLANTHPGVRATVTLFR